MEIVKSFIEGIINIYSNNPKLLLETIILIILCVLLKIYYPKFRGFMGEFWVKLELSKLPKEQYIVLNDIRNGKYVVDRIIDREKSQTCSTYDNGPLFISIDQEGGRVNRMPPEIHNIKNAYTLAKTKNANVVREAADITGTILEESGFNMNFSPVLDILEKGTTDAIGNRCYGDNPDDVSEYGIEVMNQLQKLIFKLFMDRMVINVHGV